MVEYTEPFPNEDDGWESQTIPMDWGRIVCTRHGNVLRFYADRRVRWNLYVCFYTETLALLSFDTESFLAFGRMYAMQFVSQAKRVASQDSGATAEISDEKFAKRYPTLLAFLAADEDGAGAGRDRGSVRMFVEGDLWKAFLNDNNDQTYCCISAGSFEALLAALERALASPDTDWRVSGQKGGRKPQKRR